jgi:D-arabinose 1-dehydrogenase-like Zn-dependent alcohol dehydrogenase
MAKAVRTATVEQRPSEHLGCDDGQPSAPGPGEILVRVQACGLNQVDPALSTSAISQLFAHGARYICGLDAAGTVIATGDRVTRFAVGDEVFGHFPAESWAWVESPCGRTTADGPHVELRPDGLGPLAAAALAHSGLTAKTILRAADLSPGQTALVIGATSETGAILVSLLAETGARVIASATDATEYTTGDPVANALASHPDLDLLVDLVSFGEPYFITAASRHGTIVSAQPRPDGPGIPRIGISAEPGDLAALAERALDERQPADIAQVHQLERPARHRRPTATPPPQPALALG